MWVPAFDLGGSVQGRTSESKKQTFEGQLLPLSQAGGLC